VDNPSDGTYKVALLDPDGEPFTSPEIGDKAEDWQVRHALDDYFWRFSSSITVTRTMFD
jgi:hypothetical protein